MFYFPLHFTHNQKHMECFICRLQKRIKQALLHWEEFILPVAQKSSSVYTSKPITFSPQSARLMAASLLSVIASSLDGVIGAGLIFPLDAHYSLLFLGNVFLYLIIAGCSVKITACAVVLLIRPLISSLESLGSLAGSIL